MIAPMPGAISLNTPIEDLHNFRIARLGHNSLSQARHTPSPHTHKKSSADATVEDLLTYFPMRYEDRSHPALIKDLQDGMEASLDLTVINAHGYPVKSQRGYGRPQLYIFEVSGIDAANDRKRSDRLVVCLRPSRLRDRQVLHRQARARHALHHVWSLGMGSAPQHLQVTSAETSRRARSHRSLPRQQQTRSDPEQVEENVPDPALAAIHVGRRVPVYRKLGDFNSKRVREIVHAVLSLLDDKSIEETLPADLRHRAELIGRAQALREIHFPPPDASMIDYELSKSEAHVRMIFEDFFWVAFAIGLKRGQRIKEDERYAATHR